MTSPTRYVILYYIVCYCPKRTLAVVNFMKLDLQIPFVKSPKFTKSPKPMSEVRSYPAERYTDFHGLYRIFGIGKNKAYQLINDGLIVAKKLGDNPRATRVRVLIDIESVERYIQSLPQHYVPSQGR